MLFIMYKKYIRRWKKKYFELYKNNKAFFHYFRILKNEALWMSGPALVFVCAMGCDYIL